MAMKLKLGEFCRAIRDKLSFTAFENASSEDVLRAWVLLEVGRFEDELVNPNTKVTSCYKLLSSARHVYRVADTLRKLWELQNPATRQTSGAQFVVNTGLKAYPST